MLFKVLILLSAAGVKIRERKHPSAARDAERAAALLRQLMKVPDRAFERALAMSSAALVEYTEAPREFPLVYSRRRVDSLNSCSISFSDQTPVGARADRKRKAVIDGTRYEFDNGSQYADIGFSFSPRDILAEVASYFRCGKSWPEIRPGSLPAPACLAHDNIVCHSQDSAVRNSRLSGVPLFTRGKSVPELGIIRRLFEGSHGRR